MDKYKNNLIALENLRKANRRLNEIDITLNNKYQRNKKDLAHLQLILTESINHYHQIIKNLDGFLSIN